MSDSIKWVRQVWTNHTTACLFFIALFFRVLALPFFPEPIGQEHLEIAQHLLRGGGYVYEHDYPSTYLAPFYIYCLYYSLKFFSPVWGLLLIKFFQIILSAGLAPILYRFGERIFDRKVGLTAAFVFVGHPLFVALPSTLVVDAFLIPWLYILVFLVLLWASSWNGIKAIVIGIFSGIALLTKMRSLAFLLPLWGWLLFPHLRRLFPFSPGKEERKGKLFPPCPLYVLILMVVTCLLVIAPWSIRNYQVSGSFGLEHNIGYNFWMGSNPQANGLGKYSPTQIRFPRSPELVNKLNQAKNDFERDRIFLREGLDFWRSHLGQGIYLTIKKIFLFWWIDTINPKTQGVLYLIPAVLISLFALGGLLFYPGFQWRGLSGVFLVVLGLHYLSIVITFYIPRLRLSVEPILFLYAAAFWKQLLKKKNDLLLELKLK